MRRHGAGAMARRKRPYERNRVAKAERCGTSPQTEHALHWGADVLMYGRSSSDDQERSCAQQVVAVERHSREEGWIHEGEELPREHSPENGVYLDDGVSGWKHDPEAREGSSALLRRCETNARPDSARGLILIWALSRLGRFKDGPQEAIYWIHRFRRAGWQIRSLTQPGLDSDNEDRLMAVIRAALESEKDTSSSEEKSRGVSRGKDDKIELGVWHGGVAPWGYERWAAKVGKGNGVLEWVERLVANKRNGNPDTSTVLRPAQPADRVRGLFELYAYGEHGFAVALEEIARRLNSNSVPTYRGGKAWYHTTVGKVLTNEAYLGIQRDSAGNPHPALWEPIIEQDLWDRVQERLARNHRRGKGTNSVYLLSGLLHCATCGRLMHGDATDGVAYYKAKRVAPGARRCDGCRTRVRADVVEPVVLEVIPRLADHPVCQRRIEEERDALRGGAVQARNEARELERRTKECRDQIKRLVDSLAMGGAAAEVIGTKMASLNGEIERLEREQARLRAGEVGRSPALERATEASQFRRAFEQASLSERKDLIGHLLARIDVDIPAGRVTVGFRRPPLVAA
jgi:DNA invertase Pin-like site-specific DNA recombinase